MSGAGCPTATEIDALASASGGDPEVLRHAEACDVCRERLKNARFERQFAEVLRSGARGAVGAALPVLPGYDVVREVSRGGQGIVYEAVQKRTSRRVAMKVLRQDHAVTRAQLARFEREIEIAAALQHPGIVGVYDSIAMGEGRHALVLEFVEGRPLDVGDGGRAADRAELRGRIELIALVCDAIHYAHQRGVIHRDLKPSNILIDSSGRPRVLDFGVACWACGEQAGVSRITLTGEFAGTLAYAAPEQVSGSSSPADLRTDLYAIGVMLYQLSFGRLPYDVSGSLESSIRNIASAEPAKLQSTIVNEDLKTIIVKALSKEPDRRYQSGAALAADLRRYLAGDTIEARRDSRWYVLRKSMWRHRVGVGVVSAVILGLVAYGYTVAASNARLSEALRTSRLSQARALAAAGNRAEAEELTWNELLAIDGLEKDPLGMMFGGTIASRRALWAYAESQGEHPCLAATRIASRAVKIQFLGDRVFIMDVDGYVRSWSIPGFADPRAASPMGTGSRGIAASFDAGVAVCLTESELLCRDTRDGHVLGRTPYGELRKYSARCDARGRTVLISSENRGVEVFEIPTMRCVFAQKTDIGRQHAWIDPSGERIVFITSDGKAHVRDLAEGTELVRQICEPADLHSLGVKSSGAVLAASIDEDFIALGMSRKMLVTSISRDTPVRTVWVSVGELVNPRASPSGEWLIAGSVSDSRARIFRTSDWEPIASLEGHVGGNVNLAIAPDESLIATTDYLNTMRLFGGPTKAVSWRLADSFVRPHDIAIDAATDRLWASDSQGMVTAWSMADNKVLARVRGDAAVAFTVARVPGRVVTGGTEGVLRCFDESLNPVREIALPGDGEISNLRFSPDGQRLAVAFRQSLLLVLDAESLRVLARATLDPAFGRLVAVRWSGDGKMVAVAGGLGGCEVREAGSLGRLAAWHAHDRACRAAEFSPDGKVLATTGNDGMVRLWATSDWRLLREVRIGAENGYGLSFDRRGRILAAGDRSGQVTLIDVETLRSIASFEVGDAVMALEFFDDRLAVAPLDRPMRIWDFRWVTAAIRGNVSYWRGRLEHDQSDARAVVPEHEKSPADAGL